MNEPTAAALTMGRTACWTLVEVAQSVEKALSWVYEGEQIAKEQSGWADRWADQYAGLRQALLEVQDAEAIVRDLMVTTSGDKKRILAALEQGAKCIKDIDAWDEQYDHFFRAECWALDRA